MSRAYIDFETWSPVPLRSRQRYVDSCVVLCCALRVDGETLIDPDREVLERVAKSHTLVAHNAPFDAAVWSSLGLPPATWFDTLPRARAGGLPGKLDLLGKRLEGRGKDDAGKKTLDLFIRYKTLPPQHLPIYDTLRAYCARDVELLETVDGVVSGYGEPDVIEVDRAINERGVPICVEYLEALHAVMERCRAEADGRLKGHFNPRSPKQVKEWLLGRGYKVENVAAETLRDAIFDEDTDGFLDDRKEATRAGLGKAAAGLESVDDDGRMRDQFAYCASPQGRWASYGFQLHNVPKGKVDSRHVDPEWNAVCAHAEASGVSPSDVANGMLRHAVRQDGMLVADFAAVEPRMLAWLADDQDLLAIYADNSRNVYCELGTKVFGRKITKADKVEYFISKQLVIGCGYGMSGPKFGLTLKRFGVESPVDPEELVKGFRRHLPKITVLWKAYGCAVLDAVRYGWEGVVGKIRFSMRGDSLVLTLPSGRDVWYREARIEEHVPIYAAYYGNAKSVDTVVYTHPQFGPRMLYGGKVAENVDQGLCRDMLAHALVRLEREGFEPFMHAHDEAAAQRGSFHEFMRACSEPPDWASDFPLKAEGYQGPMWSKDSSGWETAEYMRGIKC